MVDILLSTYNGEKFLQQQIDSILLQTYKNWRLLIRDDGSNDNTIEVLHRYASEFPYKIFIVEDSFGNLGATKSFEALLKLSNSDYVMLSDQDDIWIEDKIEVTLLYLQRLEKEFPNMPCMVSTDAKCIDSENCIISNSFFKSQKFFYDVEDDVEKMIALNIVQGSTCCFNRLALLKVLPIPKEQFHDKWIAVLVSYYGHYRYLRRPTLLYRQHGNNVVGANEISLRYFLSRFKKQYKLALLFYKELPFKPRVWRWIMYKLYYSIMRIIY